jgi:cytoskeletal protein RodZ
VAGAPPATPQPLVQGPVVSYGGAAGGTPFQVAGPTPTSNANSESRVQSVRVFAILLGVFALACVAVLSVVALWFFNMKAQEEKPVAVAEAPAQPVKKAPKQDTGTVAPRQVEAPKPAASKPRTTTKAVSTEPKAPKLGATASVTVTFSGATMPTSIEVSCPSGFRDRKSLGGGSATVANVPTGESCSLHPKGAGAPTSAPVRGGQSLNCTIVGTTTSCK